MSTVKFKINYTNLSKVASFHGEFCDFQKITENAKYVAETSVNQVN